MSDTESERGETARESAARDEPGNPAHRLLLAEMEMLATLLPSGARTAHGAGRTDEEEAVEALFDNMPV